MTGTDRPAAAVPTPLRYARRWNRVGLIGIVVLVWLSLAPDLPEVAIDPANWSGHGLAYASLMAWFACIHRHSSTRLFLALALCALGMALEALQGLTPWRVFDPLDMVANGLGVAAGWIASPPRVPNAIALIERGLERRRQAE